MLEGIWKHKIYLLIIPLLYVILQIIMLQAYGGNLSEGWVSDIAYHLNSQFNGWMETMYLLRSPANAKHLAESIAQVEAGKVKDHPLIDD